MGKISVNDKISIENLKIEKMWLNEISALTSI